MELDLELTRMSDETAEVLFKVSKLLEWVSAEFTRDDHPSDDLLNYALLMHLICAEHIGSILFLTRYRGGGGSHPHIGSALALVRSVVEAAGNALWVLYVGTVEDAIDLRAGGQRRKFERRMRLVGEKMGLPGTLQKMIDVWDQLNSLTHGGIEQIKRREATPTKFEPVYTDEDIIRAVQPSTMAFVALTVAVLMRERRDASIEQLGDRYVEIFGEWLD
jgi:hypothetical protein